MTHRALHDAVSFRSDDTFVISDDRNQNIDNNNVPLATDNKLKLESEIISENLISIDRDHIEVFWPIDIAFYPDVVL